MPISWRSLSLRWKLVLGSVLVEVIMLTLLVVNNVRLIEQSLHEQVDLRLRELSVLLNASIAPRWRSWIMALFWACLRRAAARKASSTSRCLIGTANRWRWMVGRLAWPCPACRSTPTTGGASLRFDAEIPIFIGSQVYGRLQFGLSTEFLVQARAQLVRESVVITVEVGLSIVLLVLLAPGFTRHLATLETASREVGRG